MADDHEYQKAKYQIYVADRASLDKASLEISGRYDQWILTLSGGALGLSLTFLEKIAPHPLPSTIVLIGIAWFFMILAMICGFVGIYTSGKSTQRQIVINDQKYSHESSQAAGGSPPASAPSEVNGYSIATGWLNICSVSTFVLGIVFLCLFAYANLPRSGDEGVKSETPRGSVVLHFSKKSFFTFKW